MTPQAILEAGRSSADVLTTFGEGGGATGAFGMDPAGRASSGDHSAAPFGRGKQPIKHHQTAVITAAGSVYVPQHVADAVKKHAAQRGNFTGDTLPPLVQQFQRAAQEQLREAARPPSLSSLRDLQARQEHLTAQLPGPKHEVAQWRRRMQRLTALAEQLQTEHCRGPAAILVAAARRTGLLSNYDIDGRKVAELLRRWRATELQVHEASVEAKDNVRYLMTLDRFVEPLYSQHPRRIIDALPSLLNSCKMIHTSSRFYNTTERMTRLLQRVANQLIHACRRGILQGQHPSQLWIRPLDGVLVDLEACLALSEAFQE